MIRMVSAVGYAQPNRFGPLNEEPNGVPIEVFVKPKGRRVIRTMKTRHCVRVSAQEDFPELRARTHGEVANPETPDDDDGQHSGIAMQRRSDAAGKHNELNIKYTEPVVGDPQLVPFQVVPQHEFRQRSRENVHVHCLCFDDSPRDCEMHKPVPLQQFYGIAGSKISISHEVHIVTAASNGINQGEEEIFPIPIVSRTDLVETNGSPPVPTPMAEVEEQTNVRHQARRRNRWNGTSNSESMTATVCLRNCCSDKAESNILSNFSDQHIEENHSEEVSHSPPTGQIGESQPSTGQIGESQPSTGHLRGGEVVVAQASMDEIDNEYCECGLKMSQYRQRGEVFISVFCPECDTVSDTSCPTEKYKRQLKLAKDNYASFYGVSN